MQSRLAHQFGRKTVKRSTATLVSALIGVGGFLTSRITDEDTLLHDISIWVSIIFIFAAMGLGRLGWGARPYGLNHQFEDSRDVINSTERP